MKKKQVVEMLDQVAEMSKKVHSIRSTQELDSLCVNKILNFCDWQHSATEKIMGIVESLERGSREQIHELEVSNQIQRAKAAAEYEWKIRSLEGRIKELEQAPKPVDFESLRGSFDELEDVRIEAGDRIEELSKANEELTRTIEDYQRGMSAQEMTIQVIQAEVELRRNEVNSLKKLEELDRKKIEEMEKQILELSEKIVYLNLRIKNGPNEFPVNPEEWEDKVADLQSIIESKDVQLSEHRERIKILGNENSSIRDALRHEERMRRNCCMALELESELLGKEREKCKWLRVRAVRAEKILSEPCPNCGEPLQFPSQEPPTEQELHESDSIGKSAVGSKVPNRSAD